MVAETANPNGTFHGSTVSPASHSPKCAQNEAILDIPDSPTFQHAALITPSHSQQSSPTSTREIDDSLRSARTVTEQLIARLRERVVLGHSTALEWGYPTVELCPLELAWDIGVMLRAAGLQLGSVAFVGGSLHCLAPSEMRASLPDVCLILFT